MLRCIFASRILITARDSETLSRHENKLIDDGYLLAGATNRLCPRPLEKETGATFRTLAIRCSRLGLTQFVPFSYFCTC
jgi:hypothetical protein